ncbi:MAG: TVP38/TMEM64 family protein [Caldilineaceae bacterium]|nr:TVP38/TMEM64 family protein [Caldilineaceae bacterium]
MVEKTVKRPQLVWSRVSIIFRQRDFWLALIAFGVVSTIFWLFSRQLIYVLHQGDIARDWILGFGFWAPLAYMGLFAMQILVAPMPGQFLGVMSGYVFGIVLGSLYSIIALSIGAGLAIYIARRFGRPLLERFVEAEQLRQWERKLYMRSPVNWGLLFVFPVPDFVFYLAGLSSIPLIRLIPAIIAGRSIGLIFAGVAGGLTAQLPPEWVMVKWAFLSAVGLLLYRHERRLRLYLLLAIRALERTTRRWQRKLAANRLPQHEHLS